MTNSEEKDITYLVITFTFEYGDNSHKMGNEIYFRIATNEQFVSGQRIYDDEVTQNYISITPDNWKSPSAAIFHFGKKIFTEPGQRMN